MLFYYGKGKVVLLSAVVVKLADRFSGRDLRTAEKAVDEYLSACAKGPLRWVV